MARKLIPQKRLAAEILGCGVNRVWIDPDAIDEVEMAVTKEDIRKLIKERKIWKRPIKGTTHFRADIRAYKRRKGRRRGPGKKRGSKKTRMGGSYVWVNRIRAIRKILRALKYHGVISPNTYNKLRRMAKAGVFKSKAHVISYIKEHEMNLKPIPENWKEEILKTYLRISGLTEYVRMLKRAGIIAMDGYRMLKDMIREGELVSKEDVIKYITEHELNLKPIPKHLEVSTLK